LLSAFKSLNVLTECKVLRLGVGFIYLLVPMPVLRLSRCSLRRGVMDGWGQVHIDRHMLYQDCATPASETCASRAKFYRNNIILSPYNQNQVITHSCYAQCYVCACYYCLLAINWALNAYVERVLLVNNQASVIVRATCIISTPTFYRPSSFVLTCLS